MNKIFYFFVFVAPTFAFAQLHTNITTIAGNGLQGFRGDDSAATSAKLYKPNSVAVDKWGSVYFMDEQNLRVRKITSSGIITSIAGNGMSGFTGDTGPATAAKLEYATGVAVDTAGNVYIADYANQRIRKVNASGIISTFAGNGGAGYSGDGGPATAAKLWQPWGVCFDKAGNLFIADYYNYCIRKVNPGGIISTVAGTPGSAGNTGDGGPATAATFYEPRGVAVDKAGNIFIDDGGNNRVRRVDALTGIITNFAGSDTGTTHGFHGEGIPATDAILYYPTGIAVDDSDYVYIADIYNNRIRVVTPNGIIHTVAGTPGGTGGYNGDGIAASAAEINNPMGVAVDSTGNIYIADYLNNRIRKVSPIHCVPHAGAISGSSFVSGCDSVRYMAVLPGGTWSASGGHIAISDSGWVRAVSTTTFGTDTVTYSVQDTCGVAKVTALVTSLSPARYDSMSNIVGKKYICFDSSFTFTDSIQGGSWSVTNTNATITSGGLVQTHTDGADTVKYSFTDNCGTTTKTYHVWVLSKHQCDSVNSVPTIAAEENNINIFPNPVYNMLTIKTASNDYTSFTITNNIGAIVMKQELQTLSTYVDVSKLPVGMYFIRFVGNEGIAVRKFLKE